MSIPEEKSMEHSSRKNEHNQHGGRKQQLQKEHCVKLRDSFLVERKRPGGIGDGMNGQQEKLRNRGETVLYKQ